MSNLLVSCTNPVPATWRPALKAFSIGADGKTFRREGMDAHLEGNWLVLETPTLKAWAHEQHLALERPGLWKRIGCGHGQRFVFEFPAWALGHGEEDQVASADESGVALSSAVWDWALASAGNQVPQGWRAPTNEQVASWMHTGSLTVRIGPLTRQGELILAPQRWALRFSILACQPAGLPPERRRALELLAADAQEHWRMIRVGWSTANDNPGLIAIVELTGAPHSEFLFLAGLDALKHGVAWLAETADLLADVTLTLRSLEGHQRQTKTQRKEAL